MSTCDQTRRITFQYLKTCKGPYAVIRPQYNSCNTQGQNRYITEISFPSVSALYVGAVVMLLKKFVVEEKLIKSSIGCVIDIVYDDPHGSKGIGVLPLYVVIGFPKSTLIYRSIPGSPPAHIPITASADRYERNCCSMTTIPLKICKVITT